jgi:hypothetical protein
MNRPLRLFTWHIHGSYLYYLSQIAHEIYVPVTQARNTGYAGRTASYPWPDNVIEVPIEEVPALEFDCILFQSAQNYLEDQHAILSPAQRALPALYLEHDPPRGHPTDSRHPVQTPDVTVVHVTGFNQLMWNCGPSPTCVIEHGVFCPDENPYQGKLAKGIAVVNNLGLRGRRLGRDVWDRLRKEVPMDLIGMGWQEVDGLREVRHADLPAFLSRYRFFFNPIRYTSLGLAVCEAMAAGLPVVGLATTELVTVIPNGVAGFLDTKPDALIPHMRSLLKDLSLARQMGEEARKIARDRFGIRRFVREWEALVESAVNDSSMQKPLTNHPLLA